MNLFQEDTVSTAAIDQINDSADLDAFTKAKPIAFDTLNANDSSAENLVPSILDDHQLSTDEISPVKPDNGNEDWIAVHLILGLVILAWTRFFYAKRFKQLFQALLGIRFQGMLDKDGNIFRERIGLSLIFIYLITNSLLIYLFLTRILDFQLFNLSSFKMFSLLMLFVILTWVVKNLINSFVGRLFQNPVVYADFALTNFIFNITISCILLPFVILAVYVPSIEMLYGALIIWVIAFIYRLIRLLFTSFSFNKFSLFHRILYLCTFELIPIFILIKLVMSYLELSF